MVSLREVALRAGVSPSTASIALRGDKRVKTDTRERVIEIAHALGYVPNGSARDLKRKSKQIIGVLLHDLGGPFYSEVLRGIQHRMHDSGFTPIVGCSAPGNHGALTRLLLEQRVDGAIVLDPLVDKEALIRIARRGLPIVVLDREISESGIYSVMANHEQGAYHATQYLLEEGFRSIAFISGPDDSTHSKARLAGFCRALAQTRQRGVCAGIYAGNFTEDSGCEIAYQIMRDQGRHRVDAVFAANDEMALGVMKAFADVGVVIGQEVAVMGFDDILIAQYARPALTTVRQPMYDIGYHAADLICRALVQDRSSLPTEAVVFPMQLVVRESTKKTTFEGGI